MLGASRWRSLREVDLPLLAPAIAAAAPSCSSSRSRRSASCSCSAARATRRSRSRSTGRPRSCSTSRSPRRSRSCSSSRSSALLVVSTPAAEPASPCSGGCGGATRRAPRSAPAAERVLLVANLAVMAVLLGLPLLALVERSFSVPGGHGLAWYRALASTGTSGLFVPPTEAIRNSLVFAADRDGHRGRRRRARRRSRSGDGAPRAWLDTGLMLPLGTSAVTIGLRVPHHARPSRRSTCAPRRSSSRSPRRWSRSRSSCGRSCPCCGRSTTACARPRRCSARRRAGRGARSTCRSSPRRSPSAPASRSRSRSASSARPCSSRGPTRRRCPIAIFRLLGRPGASNYGQAMAMATILMALTVRVRADRRARAPRRSRRVLRCSTVDGAIVRFGEHAALDGVDLSVPTGRSSPCSARAAGARRRCCARSPGWSRWRRARSRGTARDLAGAPPHKRRFGLMFQDYALFPHQDVAGNVAFGLRMQGRAAADVERPRRGGARPRRPRRVRAPLGGDAVGRRAAARRARPSARARAPTPHARRTARRPRPHAARAPHRRPRTAAAPARDDVDLRHARPRGSAGDRRSARGDAGRARRADRDTRRRRRPSRRTSSSPSSSASS